MTQSGAFGTKRSAVLRSLVPSVLGLDGWFAQVRVTVTHWPSVPPGDSRLEVLAVDLPIGAGFALA